MKFVEGFEGKYSITSDGRVWSHARAGTRGNNLKGKWLRPAKNRSGYLHVGFYTNGKAKYFDIHRLVANAYIPNPELKREVNHINGDKSDNRLENLEWATISENRKHAVATGLFCNQGVSHPFAKLTESDVYEIRKSHENPKFLAEVYGVSQGAIYDILKRRTWKHI